MAPKDPQAVQNDAAFDLIEQTLNKTHSSASEKSRLFDIRFNIGSVIEYGPANNPKHAIKIGKHQYVDLITRSIIPERELAPYIASPTRAKAVTFSSVRKKLDKAVNKGLIRPADKTIMVDFETAINHSKNIKSHELFSLGIADQMGSPSGTRGREYLFVDVFDMIVGDKASDRAEGLATYESMSKKDKVADQFYKHFTKVAKNKGIDLKDINGMGDLVHNKEKLKQILTHVNTSETLFDYSDSPNIESRRNIKTGLARVNEVAVELRNKYNIGKTGGTQPALAAFNPEKELQGLSLITGVDKNDLDILDVRGNQLFINATVMPSLTRDLSTTLGPQLNQISHRLNFSNKQRENLMELMRGGIAGVYNKATAAEDFEAVLRYSLGYDKALTYRPTAHTALKDSTRQLHLLKMQQEFSNTVIKESLHQGYRGHSVKAKFITGSLALQATHAKAHENILISKTQAGSAKSKIKLLDEVTGSINFKRMEKQIASQMEITVSNRMERGLLESNIRQFGGSTIAHLLGGALLFAGVGAVVQKAKERLLSGKEARMEGIGHESILTNLRRLAMTDFGSGLLKGISIGQVKTVGRIFKEVVTSNDGMYGRTKRFLKAASDAVKEGDTQKSIWTSIKETLSDKTKLKDVSNQLFNTSPGKRLGLFPAFIYDNVDNTKIRQTLMKGVEQLRTASVMRYVHLNKSPNSASKNITKNITDKISELFIKRGDEGMILKAPAVALGLGGAGALGIMLSRGTYDQNEMYRPMKSIKDNKYQRQESHWEKTSMMIQDIRNSSRDGLDLGSRDRERNRYAMTDFGSGYRFAKLSKLGILNRGKYAFARGTRKTSTVVSKRGKLSYRTGKDLSNQQKRDIVKHEQNVRNTVMVNKSRPTSTKKVKLDAAINNPDIKKQEAISRIAHQIKRDVTIQPIIEKKKDHIRKLTKQAKSTNKLQTINNSNIKAIGQGKPQVNMPGNKSRSLNDIGPMGSTSQHVANNIASTNGRDIMKAATHFDDEAVREQAKAIVRDRNLSTEFDPLADRISSHQNRMRRLEKGTPPKLVTSRVKNYNPEMMPDKPISVVNNLRYDPNEMMKASDLNINMKMHQKANAIVRTSGLQKNKQPQISHGDINKNAQPFVFDQSIPTTNPGTSFRTSALISRGDDTANYMLQKGNKRGYNNYGSDYVPYIPNSKTMM